jgi:predicted component of type VI protein secretion system
MKKIDREKTLLEAKSHLQTLKSRIGNNNFDQKLLKYQIENTQSLIDAINNNETLIG